MFASRRLVPALCRTGHPFAASGSREPSQKIEFVFSASPETIRREPRESPPSPSRSAAGPGSLRIDDPDVFPSQEGFKQLRFVGTRPQVCNPYCVFPRPASGPPFSSPPQAWPGCRCRVAVPFREAGPVRRCNGEPVWPPLPAPAGYACCAASISACASPCRLSSSRRCTGRSS